MAISATQVSTSDTLETFRQEFNKLRTDVNGLDSGTITVTTVQVQSSDFGNDGFTVSLTGVNLTSNKTITFPDVNGTMLTNANADLGAITSSASDVDHVLVNDGGVLKRITTSSLGIGGNPAADDIQTGDANVNITTSSGQINIGPAQSDQDVNIKGTDSDGNTNFVAVNVDMSANGLTTFSDSIKIKDGGNIGNASVADVMTLASTGIVTFKDDIKIKDGGTIGSASDADSITIASGGGVTLSQAPTFTLGSDATADIFYRSSGGPIARLGIGSAGQVLQVNSGATAPEWAINFSSSYAIIVDEKTTGSEGGAAAAGDQNRDLNTEVYDPDNIVTLSGNSFILGAGTYIFEWSAPAYKVNNHISWIYDSTNSAIVGMGSSEYSASGSGVNAQSRSMGHAAATITGNTSYLVQHWVSTSRATNGLGVGHGNNSKVNRFTQVKIIKIG